MSILKSYILIFGFLVLMSLVVCKAEEAIDQGIYVTEQTHQGLSEISSSERPKRTLGLLIGAALSRHGGGYYGGYHGGYQPYYGGYGHHHHGHHHHHHHGYHHHHHGHYHGYGK